MIGCLEASVLNDPRAVHQPVSSWQAYSCTSPWAITAITNSVETAFGPTANDWTSHHVGPLFFAAAGQDHDATRMQNLSYTKALRKQKWLGDVQVWKIRALFGLEEFMCSQTCSRALKAIPKMKKTQRWWCESFQSQEQIHERTWHITTDWLGLETMVWIPGNIYWSLSRQVTGGKPMGTKTWIPTSQRPIIASKFYQKATAANLLVQPNIRSEQRLARHWESWGKDIRLAELQPLKW